MAKKKKIASQNMIRVYDVRILDKLNEMFVLSNCGTVNEFFNLILKQVAFRENKIDIILDKLEDMQDKVHTIHLIARSNSKLFD